MPPAAWLLAYSRMSKCSKRIRPRCSGPQWLQKSRIGLYAMTTHRNKKSRSWNGKSNGLGWNWRERTGISRCCARKRGMSRNALVVRMTPRKSRKFTKRRARCPWSRKTRWLFSNPKNRRKRPNLRSRLTSTFPRKSTTSCRDRCRTRWSSMKGLRPGRSKCRWRMKTWGRGLARWRENLLHLRCSRRNRPKGWTGPGCCLTSQLTTLWFPCPERK